MPIDSDVSWRERSSSIFISTEEQQENKKGDVFIMKHAKRVFGVIAMLAVITLLLSLVAGHTIEAAYNGPWTTQTINGRREKIYDWVKKFKKKSSYFQVYIQTQHQPGYPETGGEVDYIDFDNPLYLSGEKWELGVKISKIYQFINGP